MNFEDDDLDWALGELLHMIMEAKRAKIDPHNYDPDLFFSCMHVIGRQPFAVRAKVWPILRKKHHAFPRLVLHANPVPH